MQDIKRDELRDSGSNANAKICFKIRATTLRPHLHKKGFSLCPHRTFHKGTIKELQLNTWNTQLLSQTQSSLHKREGIKQGRNKTWWSNDHKLSLGDLKRPQTIFSQNKDLI